VRRNQRLVATLRVDGLIELEDGSVHADPSTAATAAADLERPADGWRVWRFGEDGPTLGEAVGA
jgi:L-ascorbate metabolism protein UlaG (beta-lactamase superfamily)